MNFRRWVVFTFVIHLAIVVVDKAGGLILLWLTQDEPDEKGGADLLTTLPFILTAVANLGLATSLVYFVRRKKHGIEAVSETVSFVAVVWGCAIAVLALVACEWVVPALKPEWRMTPWLYAPVCLCVPFQLIASYFNSIQLATDRVRDYNLVNLAGSSLFVPLFLVCYYATGRQADHGIANARFLSALGIALLTLWMLRGVVRFRPRLHRDFFVDGIRYGWKANTTSVLTYLNHRLDLFLVGALFVGTANLQGNDLVKAAKDQVAFYGSALAFAELVWHFPEATRDLFFSKVASVSHEEARRLTPTLARICLLVALFGSVLIYLTIDPFLDWLTVTFKGRPTWAQNWSPTVMPALLLLMPGTITFTLAKILQNDLAGRGHLSWCIAACVLNLVLLIALDVLWVPREGAIGAARASSISFLVSSVFTLYAYQRCGGARWWECVVPRRSDLGYFKEIVCGLLVKLRLRRASV